MPTASFTALFDADLKAELEVITRFENCSTSSLANQAIRNLVEERKATRELLRVGLVLVDWGSEGVASDVVHDWLSSDDERAFPGAQRAFLQIAKSAARVSS